MKHKSIFVILALMSSSNVFDSKKQAHLCWDTYLDPALKNMFTLQNNLKINTGTEKVTTRAEN